MKSPFAFFHNLKIGVKILAGYVAILALVGIVGAFILVRLDQVNTTVTRLTGQLAQERALAEETAVQIQRLRLYANQYISQGQNPADLEKYNQAMADAQMLLNEAERTITGGEQAEWQAQMRDSFDRFASAFAEIFQLLATRQEIATHVLNVQGAASVEKLAVLRDNSFEALDFTSAHYASQARDTFSQMQVKVIQYLATGDESIATQVNQDLETILSTFDLLNASVRDEASRSLVGEIRAAVIAYRQGFNDLRGLTARQRDLTSRQLDVYGQAVDERAADIANRINREFAFQSRASSALVTQTLLGVLAAFSAIVGAGLLFGLALSRAITRPIQQMARAAQGIAAGALEQEVSVQSGDELGTLAGAFNHMTAQVRETLAELHKSLASLQASEERQRLILETSPTAMVITRFDSSVVYTNQRFADLFGQEKLTDSLSYYADPADRQIVLEKIQQQGHLKDHELRVKKADGSLAWVLLSVRPLAFQEETLLMSSLIEITERKRAEEALRTSEEKFSKVFHTSPDSININRLADGLFIEINQGFTDLTGYTAEEVHGKTSLELNIWANTEDRQRLAQGVRQHGGVTNLEAPFRLKDGTVKTGLMSATLLEVNGEPCILSITRDISERKRAEDALRESEEKFRTMIEQASEGFVLIDERGMIIEWNQAMEHIGGIRREEALGQPYHEMQFQFIPPERRTPERYEYLKARAMEAIQTGQAPTLNRQIEAEIHRPDGQSTFIQQMAFPIKTDHGYRIGSIVLDVTEHKLAEMARQRQLAFDQLMTRMLTRFASCSYYDMDASIETSLQEICEFTGCDHAYIVEIAEDWQTWSAVYEWCAPHVPPVRQRYQNIPLGTLAWTESKLMAGETVRINTLDDYPPEAVTDRENVWKEGAQSVLLTPISGQRSYVTGLVGLHSHLRQVTWRDSDASHLRMVGDAIGNLLERQRAEREVRSLNAELEQRVVKRTAELEAANKDLESFSYSVSHDLRAPLRGIDGYARYLQIDYAADLPGEAVEMIAQIRASAQRMNRLIDDLLNFSRMGRQPLNKRPVEPAELVRLALKMLAHERRDRQVEILVGDLAPCEGDPDLLLQVWVNLLSNALKYTRPRQVAHIEAGCLTDQNGTPVYYVKDDGVGFDMRYADKLFAVFQRLHRVDEFEGSGVGLALVQRILHRHGGRIWAEARPGAGATFYFTVQ